MTGHEHYRQAQLLLAQATYWDNDQAKCKDHELRALLYEGDARAREHRDEGRSSARKARRCRDDSAIHATLALAAATALGALTRQAIERPLGVADTEVRDALNDWHATITVASESEAAE